MFNKEDTISFLHKGLKKQQGAVRINDEKFYELRFIPRDELLIQVGKGTVFKLESLEKKKVITKKMTKCDN